MKGLSAWERVCIARDPNRLKSQDFINILFEEFYELHGDRHFGDDKSMITGIGTFHGLPVTIIAQSKGKDVNENLLKNFGMNNPEGYRKAIRAARQAEKFNRPIITFVDTSGAYPGKGAEERGQAEAIATCLATFSSLKVPIICVVISEGGSGGALALSVGDRIIMLENAIYSILSPEGFASILWKDGSKAKEAAEVMKLTSFDLKEKKIVDYVVNESNGEAGDMNYIASQIDEYLKKELAKLLHKNHKKLIKDRYAKYRKIGIG